MRVALGLVVAVVLGLSRPAEACSCRSLAYVFDGQAVPLNAHLPVARVFVESGFSFLDAGGAAVPVDVEQRAAGFVLVPRQPLVAGAAYTVTHDGETATFTAATSTDTGAPSAPKLERFKKVVSPLFSGSTCNSGGEDFDVTFSLATNEAVYLEVFTGPSASSVEVSTPALMLPLPPGATFNFGDGTICSPFLAASKVADLAVQVRVVDFAGNASELSNALQLKTGGCSATGGTSLALLALVLISRRRARRAF